MLSKAAGGGGAAPTLRLRDDVKQGMSVPALLQVEITSAQDLQRIMETVQGLACSRDRQAHSVMTISVEKRPIVNYRGDTPRKGDVREGAATVANLSFVLMGADIGATEAGQAATPKWVTAMDACFSAIDKQQPAVPYHRSKITLVLRDAINSRVHCGVVAALSPHIEEVPTSLASLKFAVRLRSMADRASAVRYSPSRRPKPSTQAWQDAHDSAGQEVYKNAHEAAGGGGGRRQMEDGGGLMSTMRGAELGMPGGRGGGIELGQLMRDDGADYDAGSATDGGGAGGSVRGGLVQGRGTHGGGGDATVGLDFGPRGALDANKAYAIIQQGGEVATKMFASMLKALDLAQREADGLRDECDELRTTCTELQRVLAEGGGGPAAGQMEEAYIKVTKGLRTKLRKSDKELKDYEVALAAPGETPLARSRPPPPLPLPVALVSSPAFAAASAPQPHVPTRPLAHHRDDARAGVQGGDGVSGVPHAARDVRACDAARRAGEEAAAPH